MSSAQIHPIHSKQLIALGRALQPANAAAARGRCLATVLEFASRARERRIAVDLVRWQLRGDPEHADHWAVRLDAGRVIDPTRVQVDGSPRLVCRLDEYPAHYRPAGVYPASVVLPPYLAHRASADGRHFPGRMLLGCHARLLGFDAVRGFRRCEPATVAAALVAFGRFALSFGRRALSRRLQIRAALLRKRLDGMRVAGGDPVRPAAFAARSDPARPAAAAAGSDPAGPAFAEARADHVRGRRRRAGA